jgi:hypothetical protein
MPAAVAAQSNAASAKHRLRKIIYTSVRVGQE